MVLSNGLGFAWLYVSSVMGGFIAFGYHGAGVTGPGQRNSLRSIHAGVPRISIGL